ncbi:Copper resistance lipoprotein NlpE [gut metagenome]|uniref:Copper resistance lipoprotein NlpE n=1 Tax=gut metagenome TaxID=749906 RepID=J9G0T9_9ZZZZ
MKKMNLALAAALLISMAACTNSPKKEAATTEPATTAAVATATDTTTTLVMTGTFEGILPAASSEGIRTSLTVNADSTYSYKQEYIGEKDANFETSGVYHLIGKDLIELVTPSSGEKTYYKRVETGYMLSDSLGTVNQGELAEHYILKLRLIFSFDIETREEVLQAFSLLFFEDYTSQPSTSRWNLFHFNHS